MVNGVVRFVNLCPHPIHLIGDNGAVVTFAESGMVARVNIRKENKQVKVQIAPGIFLEMMVQEVVQEEVVNLPEPEEGVIYLVSSYVAQYLAGQRDDLLCPNTDSTAIKDETGRVLGVKSFQRHK